MKLFLAIEMFLGLRRNFILLLVPLLPIFKHAFKMILKPKLIILRDLPANLVLTKFLLPLSPELDYLHREAVPQTHSKAKAIPSIQDVSIQEVVFEEETESDVERGDSNRVYIKNLREKEEFIKVTSKDRESESTEIDPNPLFSLLSPLLKVVCSKLLSKYPEITRDIDKWTLPLRSFMLERIRFVVSQL
nr:hypothetical protein CFP56_75047 [Quercus suber]POE79294.1 hypothetical protein CFP56_15235 [Quercus suber]